MRNSTKLYLRESVRPEVQRGDDSKKEMMYNIKMILFLILSFFAILFVMTPSRKVVYRRK
jgi:hypothetical protein